MKMPVLTYTLLDNFINCPHKAFRRYILKDMPFVSTPAMEVGKWVHKELEHRISRGTALDPMLPGKTQADVMCSQLDAMPDNVPVRVEYYLGMKIDGTACQTDNKDCWFRGKADVAVLAKDGCWLIDWKTGNVREDPFELECQAMLVAANHPQITQFVGEYFWLKEGKCGMRYTLNPKLTHGTVNKYYKEMLQYYADQEWPKRKNPLCRWCDVKDCEHNENR